MFGHSNLPCSCPNNSTQGLSEATQQAIRPSAPCSIPETFDGLKQYSELNQSGMVYPRIEKRPLSFGQRALLMEAYLSRGTSFKSRPCVTSSQFFQDLDSMALASDDRAKLLQDYIQRRGSTCPRKPATCPQQSPPSNESMPVAPSDPKEWLYNYLRNLER